MAIIDFKTRDILSSRQIKSRVRAVTGWTNEQYNKQYDILRNKARNYEKLTGTKVETPVNELLFRETLAKARYGEDYSASRLLTAIRSTTSQSTGQKIVTQRAAARGARAVRAAQRAGVTSAQELEKIRVAAETNTPRFSSVQVGRQATNVLNDFRAFTMRNPAGIQIREEWEKLVRDKAARGESVTAEDVRQLLARLKEAAKAEHKKEGYNRKVGS